MPNDLTQDPHDSRRWVPKDDTPDELAMVEAVSKFHPSSKINVQIAMRIVARCRRAEAELAEMKKRMEPTQSDGECAECVAEHLDKWREDDAPGESWPTYAGPIIAAHRLAAEKPLVEMIERLVDALKKIAGKTTSAAMSRVPPQDQGIHISVAFIANRAVEEYEALLAQRRKDV